MEETGGGVGLTAPLCARSELHELLGKPSLAGIPLLVLGNKNDLPEALGTPELIERLDLKAGACLGSRVCGAACVPQGSRDVTTGEQVRS